jgi:general secretion pathway protein G
VLRQRINEIRKNDKGFTLIELLIVIIILGVLAGVVVLAVSGINDRGEKSACKSDMKAVEVAAEAYYAKVGKYPTDAEGMAKLKTDGYLHDVPKSDKYQVAYDFTAGTPDKFVVTGWTGAVGSTLAADGSNSCTA